MSKFTYIDGCTATSINVDGKNFKEMSSDEKIDAMKKLFKYFLNCQGRWETFKDVMELLVPEIATDTRSFVFDDDGNTINVYNYKHENNKISVIDFADNVSVLFNGYECFGFEIRKDEMDFINHILEMNGDNVYLSNIFMNIMMYYGNPKFLYHCDQCGDNVGEYTLDI